jgi:hypothetical protein
MQLRRSSTVNLARFCGSAIDAVAATVEIVGAAGEAILAPATATRDTTAANITTGLAGSRTLTVSATAGFVIGRRYVIASSDGTSTILRLVAIGSGTLSFDSEVPFTSTSGTISSRTLTRATVSIPDATYRDARIVWSYTSAGATVEETEVVDIVRRPFSLDVDDQRVSEAEASFVDVSTRRPGRHVDQAKLDVENWLRSQQIKPDLVRDRSLLEQAAVWRACMLRYFGVEELREVCRGEYDAALAQFKLSKSWIEESEDNENKGLDATPRPKYILVG